MQCEARRVWRAGSTGRVGGTSSERGRAPSVRWREDEGSTAAAEITLWYTSSEKRPGKVAMVWDEVRSGDKETSELQSPFSPLCWCMLLTLARSFSRSHLCPIVQPTARSLCSHSFPLRRAMASTQDASRSKATQDSWILPTRTAEEPKLKVYNSLTRTKVSCCFCYPSKRADRAFASSLLGRFCDQEARSGDLVQLWTYRLRCFAHGAR